MSAITGGLGQAKAAKSSRHALKRQQRWQSDMYRLMLANAKKAFKTNLDTWRKTAFPNQAAIQAAMQGIEADTRLNRQQLGQAYSGMADKVFSQSATRGFGPGSGLTARSLGNVEMSKLQSIGQLMTNLMKSKAGLTQFANTAQWSAPQLTLPGMPPQQMVSPTPAGGTEMGLSDLFGTMAGFGLMNNMLGGGSSGGGLSNAYDWFSSILTPATSMSGPYGRNAGLGLGGYGF